MIYGRMGFTSVMSGRNLVQLVPCSPQSQIRNPQSDPQSENPHFAIRNPQSNGPQSAIRNQVIQDTARPAYAREDMIAARFRLARVLPYQQSHAPFISNLLLAVFSGLLMTCAFPEWNWWSLGWVCTAPLLMAIVRERTFRGGFALGWTTGTIFYLSSSYWVTYSIHHYGEISLWLSYVIALVFSALLGSFTALFAGVFALAIKRLGGWAILGAPVLWAACEWLRLLVTGVGWNALGYSQAFQPPVIAAARFGGVYIVSALLVAASTALVFGVIYFDRRRGLVVLTSVIALSIIAVAYGERLRAANPAQSGSVQAAVIQPNVPISGDWGNPRFLDQMLMDHFRLSEQALEVASDRHPVPVPRSSNGGPASSPGSPNLPSPNVPSSNIPSSSLSSGDASPPSTDLVIWPESPMNFEYDRDPALQDRLAEFTRRHNVALLMNSWGFPKGSTGDDIEYNSALIISPSGEKTGEYDKIALVPFGEYIPGRKWIPFTKGLRGLVGEITPGTKSTLGEVDGARLGMLICFEATRPDLARRLRLEGASALVQISNEAWFGPTAMPRQMLAHAIFRAVENNVDVVRATNSGLSAFVHSLGQTEGETAPFETATRKWQVKTADEAGRDELTFYTRHGDLFAVICTVLGGMLVIASIVAGKVTERVKVSKRTNDD